MALFKIDYFPDYELKARIIITDYDLPGSKGNSGLFVGWN